MRYSAINPDTRLSAKKLKPFDHPCRFGLTPCHHDNKNLWTSLATLDDGPAAFYCFILSSLTSAITGGLHLESIANLFTKPVHRLVRLFDSRSSVAYTLIAPTSPPNKIKRQEDCIENGVCGAGHSVDKGMETIQPIIVRRLIHAFLIAGYRLIWVFPEHFSVSAKPCFQSS